MRKRNKPADYTPVCHRLTVPWTSDAESVARHVGFLSLSYCGIQQGSALSAVHRPYQYFTNPTSAGVISPSQLTS
jgi:hypothetical protein